MFLDKQKTYCSQQSENSQPKQGISEISFIRRILIKEKLRFCAKARLERVKLHTNSPDQVVLTQKTAKIPDEFQNELQVCTKWSADKQGVCKAQFLPSMYKVDSINWIPIKQFAQNVTFSGGMGLRND